MIEIAAFEPCDYDEVMAPQPQLCGQARVAERAVAALRSHGVEKCHLMVRCENGAAVAFWQHLGWRLREDVALMPHAEACRSNA